MLIPDNGKIGLPGAASQPAQDAIGTFAADEVVTRTPFRISFFGGGTDYPQWYREVDEGAVLSTTIDKYCYVRCHALGKPMDPTDHPGLRPMERSFVRSGMRCLGWPGHLEPVAYQRGDLPLRSGIGSSSSLAVGLLGALARLRGTSLDAHELALAAVDLEQNILAENVGSQDQVAAAYGGFNSIRFRRSGEIAVEPIRVAPERISALEAKLMLFYTHTSRNASEIAGTVISQIPQRKSILHEMRGSVDAGLAILTGAGTLDEFGTLLHENWKLKRELSPLVSNPAIDLIYERACAAGALGGKLLGAGAGGFMLFFVPEASQARVRAALAPNTHVPFRFETSGATVVTPVRLRPRT